MHWRTVSMIVAAALALGFVGGAPAAVLNVPSVYATIDAGLDAAVPGDVVLVAPGTYRERDLVIRSGITLRGATGNPADVIVDSQRAGRCVYGEGVDATARIEALTLRNGLPTYGTTPDRSWGGGLYVKNGGPTVENCIFADNEAAIGGGAYVGGSGTPTFLGCVFERNGASEVAGLIVGGPCNPVIRDCVFRQCDYRTSVGGGLTWIGGGTALIENCTFEGNSVLESGGAVEVFNASAVAILRNCVIRNNAAQLWAAGLYVGSGGRAALENCTISGNAAQDHGGGIDVDWEGTLDATASTIMGNSAPVAPDGCAYSENTTVILRCCTVDLARWEIHGSLTVDSEGCAVETEDRSWGEVKLLYR